MARTIHTRYVRHRKFSRVRHSSQFRQFLTEQGDRLDMSAEEVFKQLMVEQGLTAEQITALTQNPALPMNTAIPTIVGDAGVVGDILVATDGTWSGNSPITHTYQWYKDDVAITDATTANYTLVVGDVDGMITVEVTGTNSIGSNSAVSDAFGPVVAA